MGLKAVIDNLDNVPEALREFYTESEGKYVLAVQGMVPKSKVDEFRNNNVELQKQMDELQNTVGSIDLDKYNDMLKTQKDNEYAAMIKAGQIDELVEAKTKAVHDHYGKELEKFKADNGILTRQLESLTIDNVVRDMANKNGIAPTAIDDVLLRAKSTFRLQDGKATPFDGDNIIYAAGTTDPLSVEGWVKGLSESAPHLFAQSSGGGSKHGARAGDGGSNNMTALEKLQTGFAQQ